MDLKFTFGGASSDHHDHGGAPSGIPLPFAGTASGPVSTSSILDVVVRVDRSGEVPSVVGEVVTGDGVTYARGDVDLQTLDEHLAGTEFLPLAKAVRSAASRAVAGLEGPISTSITAVELRFASLGDGVGEAVCEALGVAPADAKVTEDLQARIGVTEGTEIRIA